MGLGSSVKTIYYFMFWGRYFGDNHCICRVVLFESKLNDQEQANQLIISTNQNLDQQLKTLNGLQEQRDAIIERMKLIQGLQSQRPVVVRLVDELVRVTPAAMYLTKFSRTGDKFTIEGKAESPNTVAELLRNLEASPWYRNAFMSSFLATEEKKIRLSVLCFLELKIAMAVLLLLLM